MVRMTPERRARSSSLRPALRQRSACQARHNAIRQALPALACPEMTAPLTTRERGTSPNHKAAAALNRIDSADIKRFNPCQPWLLHSGSSHLRYRQTLHRCVFANDSRHMLKVFQNKVGVVHRVSSAGRVGNAPNVERHTRRIKRKRMIKLTA